MPTTTSPYLLAGEAEENYGSYLDRRSMGNECANICIGPAGFVTRTPGRNVGKGGGDTKEDTAPHPPGAQHNGCRQLVTQCELK
jgi:hypothetical protein